MIAIVHFMQGVIELGLIFGFVAYSVYISSYLIKFDNLSIEGAFGLGGALCAWMMSVGVNAWLGVSGAIVAGIVSGVMIGLLHTKLRLNHLMSGIVVTTGLFSVILKIAGSNITLGGKVTIFKSLPFILMQYQTLLVLSLMSVFLVGLITWFLKTEIGFLLRAVGDGPQMLTNVGKNVDVYIALGLIISNALAALGGALFVNYVGYFSIWSSVGVLVIGLASMMLAQVFTKQFGINLFLGAIAYQMIIALTFELQLDQDWNKLVTALLIVVLIVIQKQLKTK